jgi:Secretion system C-terminal sorting domain
MVIWYLRVKFEVEFPILGNCVLGQRLFLTDSRVGLIIELIMYRPIAGQTFMRHKLLFSLVFLFGAFYSVESSGQIVGDYRSFGGGTSWTIPANWERCVTNGVWPNVASADYPGQNAPVANTTVTIRDTHTRILDVTPGFSIVNLVVGEGTTGVLTIGNDGTARTLTMTGAVTVLAGATLQTGSTSFAHVLNMAGNLTNNGTINLNSAGTSGATFTFTGGTNSIIGTSTSATFYNLSVTGGTISFGDNTATARTLNINNDFTISSGTFQSGATAAVAHTINLTRNLTNSGTLNLTANSATNQTLTFAGAGAKTLSGAGTFTFQNVSMNTTASANSNINSNITINGTLSWAANGLLVVGTNDITLGSAAVVSSPSTFRYIQLDGTGDSNSQLIRVNNNTVATWQFLFPIGTATGGYTPLDLTVGSGASITTAPSLNSTLAVKAVLNSDVTGQMKRTFRMKVVGNSNATTFTNGQFSYNSVADLSLGDVFANYNTIWYQRESNGVWTSLTGTAPGGSVFFTGPSVAQSLANDTYFYTIGTPNGYGKTWFSYQTGNWNNALTWTLDGSIFPLYSNPTNAVPGAADNVAITSGRTVTMDVNNVSITSMLVTGTLDVVATTGHNFTAISGSGRIKIAGVVDNFPAGIATNFADTAVGGTVEVNGTGISLNAARTFNNLVINMTGSANVATLKNDFSVNGDLTISNGLFQFENATAPVNRIFSVYGNLTVSATGGIRTGLTDNRHEFNLFGDFTNNGTAYFTNRVAANTAIEATTAAGEPAGSLGIVDVNFLSGTRNQQAACNGVTRFYRLEINKGSDDTYKASISASAAGNFNLFGFANQDINAAQDVVNANALGLISGTVELGANVTVLLNTTGNYSIYQQARLWVNGAIVSKTGGAAIVPYGTVRVSAGSLTVDENSGLTLRESGVILVDGGTVTVRAIRTSVTGANAVGSYIQSGGTVVLTGDIVSNDYAVFSLTYPGNVFNMSGGTLTIQNRANLGTGNLRGAIFINSNPANVNVTGGTVIMEADNGINYRITSRVSFWNVILRGSGGVRTIELLGTTSGAGGGANEPSVTIQPLVALNDMTIENNATFVTNNADVTGGGNFEIQNGGTYTHGTNTTTITGLGVSSLTFGNTGATQTFNNLTINKTNTTDEAAITTGNATALRVNGILTVSRGIFDYATFIASARGTVTLASGVIVGKSTSTGRLLLDNSSAQTLNSSSASIHNLELNNAAGITLSTGNLTVLRTLTLTAGIFNINTRRLTLNGVAANIAGSPFSVTKMIQTSANASDGGLEMYVDANETLIYPFGVSGKYTPADATFQSFSDDGLVRINPVNGILQTTDLTGGADVLAYYWKTSHSGFSVLPLVSYQFTYVDGDIGGTEANYRPGKVLDATPFTRSLDGATDDVVDASNLIVFNGATAAGTFPGTGFTLDIANYSAGNTARFTGTPEIYYNRSNGSWSQTSTWSFSRGGGTAGSIPGAGDIVILRRLSVSYSGIVTITNAGGAVSVAKVVFDDEQGFSSGCPRLVVETGTPFSSNFGVVEVATTHQGGTPIDGNSHGAVIQYNVDNSYAGVFPGGDFGGFNNYLNALVIYTWQTGNGTITLSSAATEYPQLWFEGGNNNRFINFPNTNVNVNGRAFITGGFGAIRANAGNASTTLNFKQNLYVGSSCCGTGNFQFPQGGAGTADQIVKVDGDLIMTGGGTNILDILNPATAPIRAHRLIVLGNIDVQTGTTINLGTNAQTNVILELQGSTNKTFTTAGTGAATFFRIVMNKGTSIASTFSFNNSFTLTGVTNTATKAIELQNGLLVLNRPGTVVLSSGGGDFNIPSTAGLEVSAGTVSMTTASSNILLSGLLRVSGTGTATIDVAGFTNDIEYSNSGLSRLEVSGSGTLTVGGQVRRSLTNSTGSLVYTQSGGTVVVGNRNAASPTRGVFEVLNAGSQFNHSAGTFTIVRSNGSATVPSLWLEPASAAITSSSTINVGSGVALTNFGIQSTTALNNLTISGTNPSVSSIYISPLTVNNILTVSANNTFNSQNLDLTIGGNFVVNGTYTPGTNLTTFTNAGAADISGAGTLSFYNLTKTGAGTLSLSRDITVNRDLKVSLGTLATVTFALDLKRHAEIDATITSTSGSGLIFSGTAQQQLTRSVSGTGTLGIVTVNNSTGVIIPDGNGYDFAINNNLRLQSGVFDIGGSLLSLNTTASITPVAPFSVNNMIQTNSSFTDKGVRKQFTTATSPAFVFPVGQLYYTPITLSAGSVNGSSPSITVRPSNRRHPSIINDNGVGELPDPGTFNDLNNVLQYYWIVSAANISSFTSTMTMQYVQPLVAVVSPYAETDYIAARILSDPITNPSLLINKFSTTDVNDVANTVNFSFSAVTQDGIAGDYFAGIPVAIPNNVPIYTTFASGNVDAAIYTPVVGGGGAPTGAKVIVATGHTVTFNVNNMNLYQTQINAGGTITIPSGSIGHSLGDLSGTGDLQINSNTTSAVLPAAIYDTFLSCAGGGLIFGGTGNYEVLGGITSMRNLTLTGAGAKSLANNDITICNNLTINDGSFSNSNNQTITVQNDVLLNAGTFNTLAGTLNITRDLTQTLGTFDGGTNATKTIGRNLTINGGTFTPGAGSSNIIRINGNMTVTNAPTAIISTGSGGATGQRFTFGGSSAQILTGTFTGSRAFNRLEINNSTGLTVAGNTTIISEVLLTSGLITPSSSSVVILLEASAISTPSAGSATSFVNGKLSKILANAQTFTFPIGKGVRWRSGSVNNVSQTGSVTWDMEYIQGAATGAVAAAPAPRSNPVSNFTSADPLVLRMATGEYWRVSDGSATANGRTAVVGLSWGIQSDVSAVLAQRESMKVMSWNGTNWTNNGGTNFLPGGLHTQSRGTFESTATLSFSENIVTLGSTEVANPLPVTLVKFEGRLDRSIASLNWKTSSEINNEYFEVQRSSDGLEFIGIGKVAGNGTTNLASEYFFEDRRLLKGNNYYRLKQIDFDGKSSYSSVIVLDYDGSTPLNVFLYPNPTNGQNINLELINPSTEYLNIRILDMTGRISLQTTINAEELESSISLKAEELKAGVYVVEVIQGTQRVTKRLVIHN